MIQLSQETIRHYQAELKSNGIADSMMPHYRKWARYFRDYEAKYGHGAGAAEVVEGFIGKLASKGQSVAFQEQARQAVAILLALEHRKKGTYAVVDRRLAVAEGDRESSGMGNSSGLTVPGKRREWDELAAALVAEIKRRNYSPKTAGAYRSWVIKFGQYTNFMAVDRISDEQAKDFLTHLAVQQRVVASTQNQAFNALLFLFRHLLRRDYDLKDRVERAKQTKYIPTVLTKAELDLVLGQLKFPYQLIVSLLYGCGLRLTECLELRVSSLDFEQNFVIVHDGKGKKDRTVPLPLKLREELQRQVERVAKLLEDDLSNPDFAGAFMPDTLSVRRAQREARDLQWQWLFPAKTLTLLPDEGAYRRYHNYKQNLSSAIYSAVNKAKVAKRVTAHTFRHTFASHLLSANVDIRTIQQLLGHSDIKTTMIYTHTVQSRTKKEMVSPLDLDW